MNDVCSIGLEMRSNDSVSSSSHTIFSVLEPVSALAALAALTMLDADVDEADSDDELITVLVFFFLTTFPCTNMSIRMKKTV